MTLVQRPFPIFALAALALLALGPGCTRKTIRPEPFEVPIESRLILQVPYYGAEEGAGAAGALAEVMTFNGRPTSAERIVLALGATPPSPHALVVWARTEGLTASYYNGDPRGLVAAVRSSQPLIIRLGAPAGPLAQGDYAVVVGYNPEGVVVNSRSINQQIVPWSDFLSGWFKAGNLTISLEPFSSAAFE